MLDRVFLCLVMTVLCYGCWTVYSDSDDSIPTTAAYSTHVEGEAVFFSLSQPLAAGEKKRRVSPWHDIPLVSFKSDKLFHMVCEIPKWTFKKMEIHTSLPLNPIVQDTTKDGLPREYKYGPVPWNYGALPQTWEDPSHIDPETGLKGDGDPIDAIDVGVRPCQVGQVLTVRVLGVIALLDEGETDWKLVTISDADPMFRDIQSIDDAERLLPGLQHVVREWFRNYKIPEGKPANVFGLGERFESAEYAHRVIQETHTLWQRTYGPEHTKKNAQHSDL